MPGITRLRDLIEQSGLEQRALAEAVGISPSTLSKAASGDRGMTLESYAAFCERLGVRMDWLYGETSHPKFSARVQGWQEYLRRRLRAIGRVEDGLHGSRIALCVSLVRAFDPDALPNWFLSLHLGLRPAAIESVLEDRVAATDFLIIRSSQLFDVPRQWFSTGDPSDLVPPDVSEFADAIDLLRTHGVTPEFLIQRIDMIARLSSVKV